MSSPSKADMFWKILSSSGVTAGLFSKVTNLHNEREGRKKSRHRGKGKRKRRGNEHKGNDKRENGKGGPKKKKVAD